MNEMEYVSSFDEAVETGCIFPFFQPQINHSTGRMVGAEALIRWNDPMHGMQHPADFIPFLERNGLIYRADTYIFECVCRFQRKCMDEGIPLVPVSVNMSRYDIYDNEYAEEIERIRKKYDIPVHYLRLELTESSAVGGMELVSRVLDQLHGYGYMVEMDDFGSGYSSLNVLKDLKVDIIKLDMSFLSGSIGGRGGIILGSVVQMARWLNTPVIAEGVENMEQADFMKSIGCNYVQGYLYYRPLPEEQFIEKLQITDHEPVTPMLRLIEEMDAGRFWDPDSLETLIFSNFVGGAAIFTYEKGRVEILRVNEKYVREFGMNLTVKDFVEKDPWEYMDDENRAVYEKAIYSAIYSGDEVMVETTRVVFSQCCGADRVCIRTHMRKIGMARHQHLFYAMIRNITSEKKRFAELSLSEKRFRFASEQINMYAWEYNIKNREMRPCFRCMRDLGLPAVVRNYPEPAIEAGIFPQDYADMYRDWHRQLEKGVKELEAIIPLTVGRVPFRVRYTTEFDEMGKPLKAYGSATLVVEEDADGEEEEEEGNDGE